MKASLSVIDVETTGLSPSLDRVIEIAIVRMTPDGKIEDEFVSLINPRRDVGLTSIHGIDASDVINAPTFEAVAPMLLERLDGTVAVAGHNVRFDVGFLGAELIRVGVDIPKVPRVCTLSLSGGGKLASCCEDYGVQFDGTAHSALDDARATAMLLAEIVRRGRAWEWTTPVVWPQLPANGFQPATPHEMRERRATNPYLSRLTELARTVESATDDSASLAYHTLLDRMLEDRLIESSEAESLLSFASSWGLTREHVEGVHNDYVRRLCVAALLDGVVTEAEHRDLAVVSRLLGIPIERTDSWLRAAGDRLAAARLSKSSTSSELIGKTVCFTGELRSTIKGQLVSRETAHTLAAGAGLQIAANVTKKLDILVVADPATQSGKAKKARDYGVRVLAEDVFWKLIQVDVD